MTDLPRDTLARSVDQPLVAIGGMLVKTHFRQES